MGSRENSDGTFAIKYDDGDRELRVRSTLIRKKGGVGGGKKKSGFDSEDDGSFSVGDRVEARYGGKSQWFSGEISRENSDGTFAIKYDDGDRELRVRSNLIRKKGSVGGGKKKSGFDSEDDGSFSFGDRV